MGKVPRSKISERLIGMGDSHLDNFSFFCAATCRIPGATAHGLVNDNSVTRSREAFKSFLSAFPSYIPFLCLGEVDCNSLPWYISYGMYWGVVLGGCSSYHKKRVKDKL